MFMVPRRRDPGRYEPKETQTQHSLVSVPALALAPPLYECLSLNSTHTRVTDGILCAGTAQVCHPGRGLARVCEGIMSTEPHPGGTKGRGLIFYYKLSHGTQQGPSSASCSLPMSLRQVSALSTGGIQDRAVLWGAILGTVGKQHP